MAIGSVHTNGFGQLLGDSLVVSPGGPIVMSGNVWYVDSQTGDDTASGKDEKQAFATIGQAHTDASSGDIVVILSGHSETLTSALTISKKLVIVGAGRSDGKPTVKFTNNQAAANMFTVTADGVELRNIWFEEEAQANSAPTINVTGNFFKASGCYFEANDNTNAGCLALALASSESAEVRSCTFVSTATTSVDTPGAALRNNGDGMIRIVQCVFDGGSYGFTDGFAYSEAGSTTGATGGLYMDSITCLRGADLTLHTSSIFYVQVSADSDEPRISASETGPA